MQMKTKAGMKLKAKMKMPPSVRRQRSLDKDRIAEAVHHAVCEATGTGGSWQCLRYAHAAYGLLMHLGIVAEIECGHLDIIDGGKVVKTLRHVGSSGEYVTGHVWLRAGGTIIDLSARHFPAYAERGLSRAVRYIWGDRPDLARYTPLAGPSVDAAVMAAESVDMWAMAINAYEQEELYRAERLGWTSGGLMVAGLARV